MNLTSLFPLSKSKIDVLLEIYLPGEDYLRNLERRTKINPSLLHRLLQGLVVAGLVTREKKGRELYYSLSEKTGLEQFLEQYHRDRILQKNKDLQALFKLLSSSPLWKKSQKIILFGSWARGAAVPESDIDLLFITKEKRLMLAWCREASIVLGKTINPLIYTSTNWQKQLHSRDALLLSIVKNKRNRIILK